MNKESDKIEVKTNKKSREKERNRKRRSKINNVRKKERKKERNISRRNFLFIFSQIRKQTSTCHVGTTNLLRPKLPRKTILQKWTFSEHSIEFYTNPKNLCCPKQYIDMKVPRLGHKSDADCHLPEYKSSKTALSLSSIWCSFTFMLCSESCIPKTYSRRKYVVPSC